jgi:hypothetical protein
LFINYEKKIKKYPTILAKKMFFFINICTLKYFKEIRQGILRQLEVLVHGLGPGDLANPHRTLIRQVNLNIIEAIKDFHFISLNIE